MAGEESIPLPRESCHVVSPSAAGREFGQIIKKVSNNIQTPFALSLCHFICTPLQESGLIIAHLLHVRRAYVKAVIPCRGEDVTIWLLFRFFPCGF